MRFYSHKDRFAKIIFLGLIYLLFFLAGYAYIDKGLNNNFYAFLIVILLTNAFLYDIWIRTYYEIKDNTLFFRSGLFHGKTDIDKIVSLTKNKYLWSGFRPALSKQGVVLRYNKYSEVYISPNDLDRFIEEIKKINPTIIINDDSSKNK